MMHAPTIPALALSICALSSLACQTGLADIGSSLGESGETTAMSATGSEASESGESGSGGAERVPARGIEIVEIEANQGVQVPLTTGVEWIAPEGRNARLVGERDTLLRVHWRVAEGWAPHPVTARLHLSPGEVVAEQTVMISADSQRGSLDQTINFILDGSEGYADPGTEFELELLEEVEDQGVGLDLEGSRAPAQGAELIGFEDVPMELEIVFVPVHYTGGGLDTSPALTAETLAPLVDRLYEMTPVREVVWSIRAPLEVDTTINDMGQMLSILSALRGMDQAEPQVYYHALLDPGCAGTPCTLNGLGGISMLAGPEKTQASARVSVSAVFGSEVDDLVSTALHELGHNQGRAHVLCPMLDPGGADPAYPYAEGAIGVWGYGLRSGQLFAPDSTRSYMSYCAPAWVSDWGWEALYDRAETLTSWAFE